ncbi:MAG: T9SS type A sorting domain-containing protein, partial [Bacteroidales bacterium]
PSGVTTATLTVDTIGTGLGIKTISVDVTNSKNCVGSGTINITFRPCAGIGELKDVSFKLYPNPNNGLFTVEFNASQKKTLDINVVNESGVVVYTLNNLEVSGVVARNIDLGILPQGTYFFRISNGSDSILKKFVIQK